MSHQHTGGERERERERERDGRQEGKKECNQMEDWSTTNLYLHKIKGAACHFLLFLADLHVLFSVV